MGSELKERIDKILEFDLNPDRIYPKDIFPEVTQKQLSQINNYLKQTQGFPLDRLSAYLMRMRLEVDRKLVAELKEDE